MNQHIISKSEAQEMIGRYADNKKAILDGNFSGQDILPDSESFDKDAISLLLESYPSYAGLRLHYGMNADYGVRQIITLTDANGDDVYNLILERGLQP